MNPRFHIPVLLAFSGFLFTINLGGYDLWPPDEPRFAQVAREMMRSGDYLVPHVNDMPYTEKPPLFFWLTALLSWPFGDVTEVSARSTSAISGMVTVVLTYLLARCLYGSAAAFSSALIVITFQRFWWQARFGQIDMLLTACLTAALLCLWLWHVGRKPKHLLGFYAAIAAGVLAKGPPALVFPLAAAIAFYWGRRQDRRKLHLAWGTLAASAAALLWLVPARMAIAPESAGGTQAQIGADLYRQIVGRVFLGVSKDQPFWYYLVNLPADLAPWTLFLPAVIPWVWRHRREGDAMRLLLSWIVPALIFFSLSAGKRAIYLLPLYPAIAIVIAHSLTDVMQNGSARTRKGIAWVWAAILLGLSLAPYAVLFTEYSDSWDNRFILITAAGLLCAAHTIREIVRNGAVRLPGAMAVQFGMLAAVLAAVVLPVVDRHKSAKAFCAPLRALSAQEQDYTLYSYGFSREEYIFYADHFHEFITGPRPVVEGITLEQRAQLDGATSAAVQAVPIASIAFPTPSELGAIQDAVFDSYEAVGIAPEAARADQAAAAAYFSELFAPFDDATPAFMIAREVEWRRILAYWPDAARQTILRDQQVGRRHVLLAASEMGAQAARRASGMLLAR